MILNKLKELYKDIKRNNLTYDVFDFTKNNIDFNVLFDINSTPFKLIMIKKRSSDYIIIDVHNGFKINPHLSRDKYDTLVSMLGLQFKKGNPFSTKEFFEELNQKIPSNISRKNISRNTIFTIYQCEEKDKVYIKEIRNWDTYPHLNKSCSPENKEKTRLLYPDLYEEIKDKNISVFYTDKKREEIIF
ncbi:DUF6037 family protein [Cytobacillus firmus]|uniref:DUF6037 family protein n=1 Tax=Cytobacillus firmus TaxID=1399 RepID=UPI0018CEC74A|nr:DUF6037 family protein [Cytobacillus firmus]MBG9445297.1 hypothetical protein [Cytobacillus firmus]